MVMDAACIARSFWRSMITMYVDVRNYVYLNWITLTWIVNRRSYWSLVQQLFLLQATIVFLILSCPKCRISCVGLDCILYHVVLVLLLQLSDCWWYLFNDLLFYFIILNAVPTKAWFYDSVWIVYIGHSYIVSFRGLFRMRIVLMVVW